MQNAISYFFGAALIPELRSNISAGTASNIQLGLIAVAALGALPNELAIVFNNANFSVEAALLAVVAFRVELCVHDIFVDELKHTRYRLKIVLHVRNLNVGDGTTGRKLLEGTFELKFGKGVDFL